MWVFTNGCTECDKTSFHIYGPYETRDEAVAAAKLLPDMTGREHILDDAEAENEEIYWCLIRELQQVRAQTA